jgi:hypothetical protein
VDHMPVLSAHVLYNIGVDRRTEAEANEVKRFVYRKKNAKTTGKTMF